MRKLPANHLMIGCCYNALDCANLTPLGCLYVMFSGTTGGSYCQDCLQFLIYFIIDTLSLQKRGACFDQCMWLPQLHT